MTGGLPRLHRIGAHTNARLVFGNAESGPLFDDAPNGGEVDPSLTTAVILRPRGHSI